MFGRWLCDGCAMFVRRLCDVCTLFVRFRNDAISRDFPVLLCLLSEKMATGVCLPKLYQKWGSDKNHETKTETSAQNTPSDTMKNPTHGQSHTTRLPVRASIRLRAGLFVRALLCRPVCSEFVSRTSDLNFSAFQCVEEPQRERDVRFSTEQGRHSENCVKVRSALDKIETKREKPVGRNRRTRPANKTRKGDWQKKLACGISRQPTQKSSQGTANATRTRHERDANTTRMRRERNAFAFQICGGDSSFLTPRRQNQERRRDDALRNALRRGAAVR